VSAQSEGGAANRAAITVCTMMATTMNTLDTTIVNVALPHMQGSVSAAVDQITWVLTSYVLASAIGTPITGWLAGRIGRKRLFLISLAGFTIASMLCGLATSLLEIVVFRVLQGVFGAPLVPLSQTTLLDIYPPQKHGQAMAIWSAGALVGPVFGPTFGGWLTDQLSWRWCFFINLPVGILALIGIWIFVSPDRPDRRTPLDFLGFGALVVFACGFQLMLDRGGTLDWFASPEIWVEAIVAGIALWVFIVQMAASRRPFVDPRLFGDRNFVTACIFAFVFTGVLFANMALAPPMLQGLLGYSVMQTGMLLMPRGVGSLLAMLLVGRLVGRMDTRIILGLGLATLLYSTWTMTRFDLMMDSRLFFYSGFFQGLGAGLVIAPTAAIAFATIPARLRAEGSSMYTLARNLAGSIGISIMQVMATRSAQVMHSSLAEHVRPGDPVVSAALGADAATARLGALAQLDAEITRQATMVAYVDDYRLMFILILCCVPLLLLLRPLRSEGKPIHVARK
jgi:DHA2 family multidrug resistance protein